MVPVAPARSSPKPYLREPLERLIVIQLMQQPNRARTALQRSLEVDGEALEAAVESLSAAGVVVATRDYVRASQALQRLERLDVIAV